MLTQKIIGLAIAGAIGALARYGLAGAAQRLFDSEFPWGTVVVNITGCFLAGFLWSIVESRVSISGEIRTIVFIGFLGAFTTFSTFALETGALIRDSQWLWAAGNVIIQNGVGIAVLFLGLVIGRLL